MQLKRKKAVMSLIDLTIEYVKSMDLTNTIK